MFMFIFLMFTFKNVVKENNVLIMLCIKILTASFQKIVLTYCIVLTL